MLTEALDRIGSLSAELSDQQKQQLRAELMTQILTISALAHKDAIREAAIHGAPPPAETALRTLRMGNFGGIDSDAEAFVVEVEGLPQIADRASGLRLAAKAMGFELYEPTPVQRMEDGQPTGETNWEVWYTYSDSAQMLCSAPTQEEAERELEGALESLVGSMLNPALAWAKAQQQVIAEAPKRERRKPSTGHVVQATLQGTWKAAGVYTWEVATEPQGKALFAKTILDKLNEPAGLSWNAPKGKAPTAQIQLLQIDGRWLANVHDLIAAARKGVLCPEVAAWPECAANQYVVQREFMRYMRAKGWRPLWWQEKPTGGLRLHGRVWMRDKPIQY